MRRCCPSSAARTSPPVAMLVTSTACSGSAARPCAAGAGGSSCPTRSCCLWPSQHGAGSSGLRATVTEQIVQLRRPRTPPALGSATSNHGALYHDAAIDPASPMSCSRSPIGRAWQSLTLPGKTLHVRGAAAGTQVFTEGFADRAYRADGTCSPGPTRRTDPRSHHRTDAGRRARPTAAIRRRRWTVVVGGRQHLPAR